MIPVVWVDWPARGKNITRGYWDQGLLERWFAGDLWPGYQFTHHMGFDGVDGGAVVVLPARYHLGSVGELNAALARLPWVLLLCVSDEERLFPIHELTHPNMRVWLMTPRANDKADGYLGEYVPPHAFDLISSSDHEHRDIDWFWSGQVNHERRASAVAAFQTTPGGEWHSTPGFTKGLEPADYYAKLCSAKVVPCPSGPATPDSFRVYEALEAGCVPIADDLCPQAPEPGYWSKIGRVPFPVLTDWEQFPSLLADTLADWPASAHRCFAWWQGYKRDLSHAMNTHIHELSGIAPKASPITVIIPTSPIPSHPSTSVIEQTVASVRDQLPDAHIIVACDGVRPELDHRRADYDTYVSRLLWLSNHEWRNVLPIVADEHLHQGNLTRQALEHVHTPLVLFVEHDTPIYPPIPWPELSEAVLTGRANLVRLHHEALVLDVHQHLMLDRDPVDVCGAPMLRTAQWSQRPHLASTEFYRHLIRTYFGTESRTMIEDVMHGVVDHAYRTAGEAGWDRWRLWMYAPEGDMKRSGHLDGREGDPKFDDRFVYAYDDGIPEGAPYPTALRT